MMPSLYTGPQCGKTDIEITVAASSGPFNDRDDKNYWCLQMPLWGTVNQQTESQRGWRACLTTNGTSRNDISATLCSKHPFYSFSFLHLLLLSFLKIPPLFIFPPSSTFETNEKLLQVLHDTTKGAQEKAATGATTRPGACME